MSNSEVFTFNESDDLKETESPDRLDRKTIAKHLALFIATFVAVTVMGAFLWVGQTANAEGYMDLIPEGALFATLFLLFLGTHEFGHYFAALYHNIKVTLPYFIPVPFGIGTIGAVIRIKEQINDTWKLFDIGIAGPLAGFIVSFATLIYGFATLPGPEFIANFAGHEPIISHVEQFGSYPSSPGETDGMLIVFGHTLLYDFLASFFNNVPPMWEMYHYPFLLAGWLGLFFTALNLTPVGQLDGGHIVYSLLGFKKHRIIARIFLGIIVTLAGIEAIPFLHETINGWVNFPIYASVSVWGLVLFFILQKAFKREMQWIVPVWSCALIISAVALFEFGSGIQQSGSMIWVVWSFFLTYLVGLEHPPALYERPLSPGRKLLGWSSMIIFILCISPNPIYYM